MASSERLARLRAEVAAGDYAVEPALIADAILSCGPALAQDPELACEVIARDYNGEEIARAFGIQPNTVYRILRRHYRPAVHVLSY